jgi:hypothetical protein
MRPKRKAAWAREIVARMKALLTVEQCREIMERRCCRVSAACIRRGRKLRARSESLEDFARAQREAGWDGFLCKGDALHIRMAASRCRCSLVRGTEEPIAKTYCLCGAGHLRHWLEAVFERSVRVEPVTTVIDGDPECWFVAHVGRD